MDRTEDGKRLKLLTVIDEFNKQAFQIECRRSMTSGDLVRALRKLFCSQCLVNLSGYEAITAVNSSLKQFRQYWCIRHSNTAVICRYWKNLYFLPKAIIFV